MNVDNYFAQLQALLPRGAAWSRSPDSFPSRLLKGFAATFARVHTAATTFLDEIDPRTTTVLLEVFEEMHNLPEPCITLNGIEQTFDQRRAAVVAKRTAKGGASRPFFIETAAKLGYEGATIDLFRPATCNSDCNAALWSEDDRWTWQLNVPATTGGVFVATCNSPCDAPLASWGDEGFECHINQIKPGETTAIFAYQ